jgi:hypothetical protein
MVQPDPRLKKLQDHLKAAGTPVPATDTVEQLEKQLQDARMALRQFDELMDAKIEALRKAHAEDAEPVETYIVELERRIREVKKSKKSKSVGRSGARRLSNIGLGMQS